MTSMNPISTKEDKVIVNVTEALSKNLTYKDVLATRERLINQSKDLNSFLDSIFKVEFTNIPTKSLVDNLPDDITGAEIKRLNKLADSGHKFMLSVNHNINQVVSNERKLTELVKAEYPELSDLDLKNISAYVADEMGYDAKSNPEFNQNFANAAAFANSIKTQTKLFSYI